MISRTFKTVAFAMMAQWSVITVAQAQNDKDPVLLSVGGSDIRVSEFEAVYRKNNQTSDKQALEEYLDLYIKFRLKVKDATELGLDTLRRFKQELAGYRKQLAEPYLSDNEVTEQLIQEAYDRLKEEVKASHILIEVAADATPADTLKAFQKAMDIRQRALKGEDFGSLAAKLSADPSGKENKGDLGYFTAFYMVYPCETAAYNTKVGDISMPVRTQFGYHLIKVTDRKPNPGEITVEHIMIRIPKDASEADVNAAEAKITEIKGQIQNGASFEELAGQFSDDKGSSSRGGRLPAFGPGRMVPEFEEAAFGLKKDGDVSDVVKTQYGFHIIKRVFLKPIGTFDEMLPELKQRIQRDKRANMGKAAFVEKMKKEYNYTENAAALKEMTKLIDSTYFKGERTMENSGKLNMMLFKLGDTTIYQRDFMAYVLGNRPPRPADAGVILDMLYKGYVQQVCITYEDVRLEKKYPEFRLLMKEYHDGILLFDLTDQKVWSKAVKDTAGLEAFYQKHKGEYMWDKRLDAVIYNCANEKVASDVRKLLKAKEKKGYTNEDILKMSNESSALNLEMEEGKFSKGDNAVIDQITWNKGISDNVKDKNRVAFIEVKEILEPQAKELNEVRGLMTSAYQNYLEEQWIEELRKKYTVEVHKEHLSLIK